MGKKFSAKERLNSFKYAFNGFKILLSEEHNARIHLVITVLVVIAGFLLGVSAAEWCLLVLCIGLVIAMEALNSSIENLSDFVSPGRNDKIKKVKDLAAFAVLICALASVVVGLIIFVPKVVKLLL
ncbi:MAG: diacylglycerol kinase family protein [Dysgonomonas sp.]